MTIQTKKINDFVDILKGIGDLEKELHPKDTVLKDWKVAIIKNLESSSECGFYGVVLKNSKKELLMAFRGTNFGQANDVKTDIAIGLDNMPEQIEEAYSLYEEAQEFAKENNCTITTIIGHSLGGGLAEFVGALSGIKTYTFNGIGVKHLLDNIDRRKYDAKNCSKLSTYSNIENYISKIDTVGNLFEHCSKNSFYISRPKEILNNKLELPLIIGELRMIRALAATSNTIADFIHKLRFEKEPAAPKAVTAKVSIFNWVLEAHKVDNFKDLDDNYSRTNNFLGKFGFQNSALKLSLSQEDFEIASQNADDTQDVEQFTNPAKLGFGMGWVPDFPNIKDYTSEKKEVQKMLDKTSVPDEKKALPEFVDLREFCSPIENQETLGSCTANAGVGLVEYFEKKSFGKHINASRLFLYKTTRNLLHWTGDTGAHLRTTMEALVLFGTPPEEYYPYDIAAFDEEPNAFCYSFAQNFQAINYLTLDPLGTERAEVLQNIKNFLASGFPSIFGFTVYGSISQAGLTGKIPYPSAGEKVLGGHAVMTVGYDDNMLIKNTLSSETTKGALIIRNSWGTSWGDAGYGYLPYKYITDSLAIDWWTLIKQEWVDTGQFKRD